MSRNVKKRTFGHVRPAKIQISLRIQKPQWLHFNRLECKVFFHADNEDSNQTARMRSLIWDYVGRKCQKVRFLTLRRLSVSLLIFRIYYSISFCYPRTSFFIHSLFLDFVCNVISWPWIHCAPTYLEFVHYYFTVIDMP